MAYHRKKTQMTNYVDLVGKSGKTYRYWFLANITAKGIQAVAGNYAFLKKLANGNFVPVYFGQAEDLQSRIPTHERWDEARRIGASGIAAHSTTGGEQARLDEERDLIEYWHTPLNTHHRKAS